MSTTITNCKTPIPKTV